MSKGNKVDAVYTEFYEPHLNGSRANNPNKNLLALTEQMYMRNLTELCANRFHWSGLPDSIDERFLELTLFWRALSVFYYDYDYNRYMALRASGAGHTNMYDNPTSFTVTGGSMINKQLGPKNCVPIWANYLRVPDLDIVRLYSARLAEMDRTIDINTKAMRHTSVITTDENQRLSWVNLMRQHSEGQPYIFGTQNLDMSNVQAFNISPHPESLPNLLVAKAKLWNECMGLLGINNANQDKKERLVAAEVGANDEQVMAARNINLNARKQACEQINRMFNLRVDVDIKLDSPQPPQFSQGIGQ